MSIGAWPSFVRGWRRQPAMHMATLSVLVGGGVIFAAALLIQQNLEQYLTQWGKEVRVNVYLKDDATTEQTSTVKSSLDESGLFSKVEYFSKEAAAKKFKSRVGQYAPELLSDLDTDNPLPESFEATVSGGLGSNLKFEKIMTFVGKLREVLGVEEISYGQGWVENYASVLKVFSMTSYAMLFVLLLGSLFVTGNSIRSSVAQRKDEIEIMELFGATRGMIIWPFIFEGCVMGLLAAALALVLTYFFYIWQMGVFARDLNFWGLKENIHFLSGLRIISMASVGAFMGGLGAYLCVRKIATGYAAAEASGS